MQYNSVFLSEMYQTLEGSFSSVSKPIFATKYSFPSIFRDLQDLESFAPLESQVENYLEKNLPENPKENERTRPHGKVEKVETTREAWNSAETMRRTTAERRAAAENIFMHFHVFAHLPNSKSSQKFVKLFPHFCSNFCKNPYFSTIFIEFCTDFDDFFFRNFAEQ